MILFALLYFCTIALLHYNTILLLHYRLAISTFKNKLTSYHLGRQSKAVGMLQELETGFGLQLAGGDHATSNSSRMAKTGKAVSGLTNSGAASANKLSSKPSETLSRTLEAGKDDNDDDCDDDDGVEDANRKAKPGRKRKRRRGKAEGAEATNPTATTTAVKTSAEDVVFKGGESNTHSAKAKPPKKSKKASKLTFDDSDDGEDGPSDKCVSMISTVLECSTHSNNPKITNSFKKDVLVDIRSTNNRKMGHDSQNKADMRKIKELQAGKLPSGPNSNLDWMNEELQRIQKDKNRPSK